MSKEIDIEIRAIPQDKINRLEDIELWTIYGGRYNFIKFKKHLEFRRKDKMSEKENIHYRLTQIRNNLEKKIDDNFNQLNDYLIEQSNERKLLEKKVNKLENSIEQIIKLSGLERLI